MAAENGYEIELRLPTCTEQPFIGRDIIDLSTYVSRRTGSAAKTSTAVLPFRSFSDLTNVVPQRDWIFKDLLALRCTSAWIAPPGAGKSTLIANLAVHAAAGLDWRGYASKRQTAVLFIALERGTSTELRILAEAKRRQLLALPVAVHSGVIDLLSPGCVSIIEATIQAAEQALGLPVGIVIVDTYNKGIAAGGGDEDKARDQNRTLANLRRVQELTGVHIALVGHTGKDETRGARGSNALLGDVDLMVQLSGDFIKTATITRANDQPEGMLTRFTLDSFSLGQDQDGDPITIGIVSDDIPDQQPGMSRSTGPRLSNQQQVAFELLRYAISENGETPPACDHIPYGVKAVRWDVACRYLQQGGVTSSDDPRRIFDKIRDGLKAKGCIGFWKPWLWIVPHPQEAGTKLGRG